MAYGGSKCNAHCSAVQVRPHYVTSSLPGSATASPGRRVVGGVDVAVPAVEVMVVVVVDKGGGGRGDWGRGGGLAVWVRQVPRRGYGVVEAP